MAGGIVADFHKYYFESNGLIEVDSNGACSHVKMAPQVSWLGVRAIKYPCDLWVYQEILYECQPDLIVEAGTAYGGSALFLATVLDAVGHGRVLTIDTVATKRRPHPRIEYYWGDVVSLATRSHIVAARSGRDKVMFIFDDDHSGIHVQQEMEMYADLVTPGQYMIVEDTNINGHPVAADSGDGPFEAVQRFLVRHREFTVDRAREKFLMTYNPGGYLRKTRSADER